MICFLIFDAGTWLVSLADLGVQGPAPAEMEAPGRLTSACTRTVLENIAQFFNSDTPSRVAENLAGAGVSGQLKKREFLLQ